MPTRSLIAVPIAVVLLAVAACNRSTEIELTKQANPPSVIRIEVTETGFTPSDIELDPGQSSVLEFVRTAERTCATAVVFPDSGIRHDLPLNEPVRVTVQPNGGRRFAFVCPMDMYRGSFGVPGMTDETLDMAAAPTDGVLEITVDEQGFHPSRLLVSAGEATVLRFTRTAEHTCNTAVHIPDLSTKKDLPLNESVDITVTPDVGGEIAFSCPMEMSTGVIEVREGGSE